MLDLIKAKNRKFTLFCFALFLLKIKLKHLGGGDFINHYIDDVLDGREIMSKLTAFLFNSLGGGGDVLENTA